MTSKAQRSVVFSLLLMLALSLQGTSQPIEVKSGGKILVVTVLQLKYHGQAVVLQTPTGNTFMIDSGSGGDQEGVEKFLRSQHITRLDGLLISHPHNDHQGGAPYLLRHFPVNTLFLSPFDRKLPAELKTGEIEFSLNLRRLAKQQGVKVREVFTGQKLNWDPALKVEVLWPPSELFLPPNRNPHETFNGNSVVLRIQYGDTVFLFPGDLTDEAGKRLIEQQKEKLKTDILTAPHHGFFNSQEFAQATQPRVVVASCIVDYPDHPTKNVPGINAVKLFAPLGTRVYVTAWQGTVRIESDSQHLRVTTEDYLTVK